MANQRVYLYEVTNGIQTLGNSMSTSYEFDGKELTIFWKGRKQSLKASIGEAFVVKCDGSMPEVVKLKLPKNNHRLILWLCGFTRYNSITNAEEFEEELEERRKDFQWWNYREFGPYTEEYAMVICNRSDCGGTHHVLGFVDGKLSLTTEKVIEILNSYYKVRCSYFPIQFVKEVLRKRFNMDDLDLEKIQFES